jgi:murein endopeptidase
MLSATAAVCAAACAGPPAVRSEPMLPAAPPPSSPAPPVASQPAPAPAAAAPEPAPEDPPEPSASAQDQDASEQADDNVVTPEHEEAPGGWVPKTPIDGWSRARIEDALVNDPALLGSMSIGSPDAGALWGGVQMKSGPYWEVVGAHAWGTKETIDDLVHCIQKVNEEFPGSSKMFIGDISAEHGGHLYPHVSHQAGRDADVSYYYLNGAGRWYLQATAENLDRARTWTFVRALITDTDVELILMDRSIKKLIEDYALSIGEDPSWLNDVFHGRPGKLRPLIIHWPGHTTHMHVRFYSPVAQQTAHLAYHALMKHGLIHGRSYFIEHVAQRGDTLHGLAARFHTTVRAIRRANGLRTTRLIAHRTYKIPAHGGVAPSASVLIPPRRLPPPRVATKASRAASGS